MHYIRFLRPPAIDVQKGQSSLSLVLVVSTDLGDALLSVNSPLALTLCLFTQGRDEGHQLKPEFKTNLSWKPGARVLKISIPIPTKPWKQMLIRPADINIAARQFSRLASPSGNVRGTPGLIVPVWFDFSQGNRTEGRTDVCLRKLHLVEDIVLEFEEEFGDSIARHVWDGGLAAVSFLTQTLGNLGNENRFAGSMPCLESMIRQQRPLNIIEVGCGVGVLGTGLSGLLTTSRQEEDYLGQYRFLMTDIVEAEERATANIQGFLESQEKAERKTPQMKYENLDWEDGREGKFDESVMSPSWDVVIISDCTYNTDTIPSLVETLSQLESKTTSQNKLPREHPLRIFLATKPRHSSERAFFDLMPTHGWVVKEQTTVYLLHTGSEPDLVELYLFERK